MEFLAFCPAISRPCLRLLAADWSAGVNMFFFFCIITISSSLRGLRSPRLYKTGGRRGNLRIPCQEKKPTCPEPSAAVMKDEFKVAELLTLEDYNSYICFFSSFWKASNLESQAISRVSQDDVVPRVLSAWKSLESDFVQKPRRCSRILSEITSAA